MPINLERYIKLLTHLGNYYVKLYILDNLNSEVFLYFFLKPGMFLKFCSIVLAFLSRNYTYPSVVFPLPVFYSFYYFFNHFCPLHFFFPFDQWKIRHIKSFMVYFHLMFTGVPVAFLLKMYIFLLCLSFMIFGQYILLSRYIIDFSFLLFPVVFHCWHFLMVLNSSLNMRL